MATPVLGLHLDHRAAAGEAAPLAEAIAEIFTRPCFGSLVRVAAQRRDGDPSYQPKDRAAIAAALLDPGAIAVVLEDERRDPPAATARICTGRQREQLYAAAEPRPLLASTIVVPAERAHAAALLDAFVELTATLQAVAGFVAVEPDHDRARGAALGLGPSRGQVRGHYRRSLERRAHAWYDRDIEARIAGPEWGVVFGPRHLDALAPDPACFAVIRDAGAAKLALLSEDPEDALDEEFDRRLDAARQALAPILMDVARVPVL
jgi:hypothetical protein